MGADSDAANPARLMFALDGDREPILAADGVTWTNLPTWTVAFTNGTDEIVAVSFAPSTPGKAYAISNAGLVFRKADVNAAGAWAQPGVWATTGVGHLAVNGVHDDRLYASTDEGDTWTAYDQGLPNAAVQQLYWSSGSLYSVTYGRGIWQRTPC